MKSKNLNLKEIIEKFSSSIQKLGRYSLVIFLVFVAVVYAFVVFRINTLDNVQPSADAISTQSNPVSAAKIDPTVVKQLEALRDNNVSVQTLFEQARNNPFNDTSN